MAEEEKTTFSGSDRFAAVLATAQADLTKSHPEKRGLEVKILWAGERNGKVSVIAAAPGFLWRYVEVGDASHIMRYEVASTVTAPIKTTDQLMAEAQRIVPKGMIRSPFQRKPTEEDRLAVEKKARERAEREARILASQPKPPKPEPPKPIEVEIVPGAPGKPNVIIRPSAPKPAADQPKPKPKPRPQRPLTPKEQAAKMLLDLSRGGSPTRITVDVAKKKPGGE